MNWSPHDYQKEAIRFTISHGSAALFLDPGLGKTSITYAAFKLLRERGLVQRMLVVSPLRPAVSVWPAEQVKWNDFHDIKVQLLHGKDKDDLLWRSRDVDIINPEGLQWLFHRMDPKSTQVWPWDMIVVDESTKFKHSNTERFKSLRPALPRFKRRYILTGSPAPNGLLDLFGQIYILDLGRALGPYITHYRRKFFDATGFGGYSWQLREGSKEKIEDLIRPYVLRMAAEDYIQLPPIIYNDIHVEMPDKAWTVYDQMETHLIAELKKGTVTAANAATATSKCRQIANGGIYYEDHTWELIHRAKAEAALELVEELQGKPALVAYEFGHDLARLKEVFPDAPYLGGGVTPHRQREIEAAWNFGALPVLLAQPQSVAHGLNLQGVGAAIIWHSLTWNLEDYDQLNRRVWRQGQRERVVVHHLLVRGTLDDVVLRTLGSKEVTQSGLLGALERHLGINPKTSRTLGV